MNEGRKEKKRNCNANENNRKGHYMTKNKEASKGINNNERQEEKRILLLDEEEKNDRRKK